MSLDITKPIAASGLDITRPADPLDPDVERLLIFFQGKIQTPDHQANKSQIELRRISIEDSGKPDPIVEDETPLCSSSLDEEELSSPTSQEKVPLLKGSKSSSSSDVEGAEESRHFDWTCDQGPRSMQAAIDERVQAGAKGIEQPFSATGKKLNLLQRAVHTLGSRLIVASTITEERFNKYKNICFFFACFFVIPALILGIMSLYASLSMNAPGKTGRNIILTILGSLLFIGIVYGMIQFIRSNDYPLPTKAYRDSERQRLIEDHDCRRFTLRTPDHLAIDGMYHKADFERSKKLIIHVTGQGGFYETVMGNRIERAKRSIYPEMQNADILMINPRGVGESEGTPSPDGFALDVYTAYKYAIEKLGYNPEDVIVEGFSLGGSYGALGAALIQEEYPDSKINFVSICSFKDLETEVRLAFNGRLARAASLLNYGSWQINAKAALDKLKGTKIILFNRQDQIIPYEASVYKALKEDFLKQRGSLTSEELRKHIVEEEFTSEIDSWVPYREIIPSDPSSGRQGTTIALELNPEHRGDNHNREFEFLEQIIIDGEIRERMLGPKSPCKLEIEKGFLNMGVIRRNRSFDLFPFSDLTQKRLKDAMSRRFSQVTCEFQEKAPFKST